MRWFLVAVLFIASACKYAKPPPVATDATPGTPDAPAGSQPDANTAPDSPTTRYTLTVIADGPGVVSTMPAGINCSGNTCTEMFDEDQQVKVSAQAENNASFVGYMGACSGALTDCTVAMTSNLTVTASFVAFQCTPNTVSCSTQVLNTCDAQGMSHPTTCAFGCDASGPRCFDMLPSNTGMAACLDASSTDGDVTIPDGATIDTDKGTVTDANGDPITMFSQTIAAPPDGVEVRCFHGGNIAVGDVTVVGAPALAIAANGAVTINGKLSVDPSAPDVGGPGILDSAGCTGGKGTAVGSFDAGGGGGGGFGGAGGAGGLGSSTATGGTAGAASGNPELVPLRGGCSGGQVGNTVLAPNAAGALQIVSRVSITISGGVSASGGGGYSEQNGGFVYTGGGGSGGGILLEAPAVTVGAQGYIVANGGGGGGTTPGSSGLASTMNAPGGAASDAGASVAIGQGGLGGALAGAATRGHNSGASTGFGGGGGGGVGRIRVNTYSGLNPMAGAVLSPTPTTGAVGTR